MTDAHVPLLHFYKYHLVLETNLNPAFGLQLNYYSVRSFKEWMKFFVLFKEYA